MNKQLENVDAIENDDFSTVVFKNERGNDTIDYALTIDIAKEICMMENNEFCRQARRYFLKMSEFVEIYGVKVNRLGEIISLSNKKGIGSITSHGYRETYTNLRKNVRIHRLVAEAFIPNPNNFPCVNHKDGNKSNNNVFNLEWCSHSYNEKHAYENGLKNAYWENKGFGARTKTKDYYINKEHTLSNWKKIFKKNNWEFNNFDFIKNETPIINVYGDKQKVCYKYKYIPKNTRDVQALYYENDVEKLKEEWESTITREF